MRATRRAARALSAPERLRPALLGALALLVATACANLAGPSDARAELDAQRRKWRAQALDSYEYRFERVCFCAPEAIEPVTVVVRAGRIVAVTSDATGGPVERRRWPTYLTVEQAFDTLQAALDRRADRVSAEYHPEWGHPVDVWIDFDERLADEELGFRIERLRPLPRP